MEYSPTVRIRLRVIPASGLVRIPRVNGAASCLRQRLRNAWGGRWLGADQQRRQSCLDYAYQALKRERGFHIRKVAVTVAWNSAERNGKHYKCWGEITLLRV